MNKESNDTVKLPTPQEVRQGVEIYLQYAYEGSGPPEQIQPLLPPEGDFDVAEWLSGEMIERDPPQAGLDQIKTADVRLGNVVYPNMKFRLSRLPNEPTFVFSVDSHDAVLQAPAGSPDAAMLEELKAHNATVNAAILKAWDEAGLPTERNYLRRKLQEAKDRQARQGGEDSNEP
jgi:hypothetical protein